MSPESIPNCARNVSYAEFRSLKEYLKKAIKDKRLNASLFYVNGEGTLRDPQEIVLEINDFPLLLISRNIENYKSLLGDIAQGDRTILTCADFFSSNKEILTQVNNNFAAVKKLGI